MIDLVFLGTGGAFTDFRTNYHNNAIFRPSVESKWTLIDCGGTAVQSLKELGIKPWEIEEVVITHLHGDHVNGLEQLIWERYYTGENGPGFLTTRICAPYPLIKPLRQILEPGIDLFTTPKGEVRPGGVDALVEWEVFEHSWKHRAITFRKSDHVLGFGCRMETYSLQLKEAELLSRIKVLYTSDAIFSTDLDPHWSFIFHDCTFSPAYPGTVHTHYEQLLTLPENIRKKIILMHHTKVPEGIDVISDGFVGAASRHEHFRISSHSDGTPFVYSSAF